MPRATSAPVELIGQRRKHIGPRGGQKGPDWHLLLLRHWSNLATYPCLLFHLHLLQVKSSIVLTRSFDLIKQFWIVLQNGSYPKSEVCCAAQSRDVFTSSSCIEPRDTPGQGAISSTSSMSFLIGHVA